MSPRVRVALIVAAAAAGAAALAVAGAVVTRQDLGGTKPRGGFPPLVLDLGLRTDPEATALRRAVGLYDGGKPKEAQPIFDRFASPQARVGAAFARWPNGSVGTLEGLAEERPRDPDVLLNLGIARLWAGDGDGGVAALRRADKAAPDTLAAVRAKDLLHPDYAPGVPTFVPSFAFPPDLAGLSPPRQFAALERRARTGGARDKLLFGIALQRLGRQLSAERVYAQAALLAPGDPEAQVAAAVGRFDKDAPSQAFSRLGPLVRRFPRSPTVRFHLGLLLLWIGQVDEAKRQLARAERDGPSTVAGREARRFLDRLGTIGTK